MQPTPPYPPQPPRPPKPPFLTGGLVCILINLSACTTTYTKSETNQTPLWENIIAIPPIAAPSVIKTTHPTTAPAAIASDSTPSNTPIPNTHITTPTPILIKKTSTTVTTTTKKLADNTQIIEVKTDVEELITPTEKSTSLLDLLLEQFTKIASFIATLIALAMAYKKLNSPSAILDK